MMTSFILTIRYSCGGLPPLRWVMIASLRCVPVAQALRSRGDALSVWCTKDRSWKVALPAPPPPPVPAGTELVTPHENESTSISSLCLASPDSPLMSDSLAKIFDGIALLLLSPGGAAD